MLRYLRLLSVVLASAWLVAIAAHAEGVISIAENANVIDISNQVRNLISDRRNAAVELQPDTNLPALSIDLLSRGKGPVFHWSVATLTNASKKPRSLVMVVDHQRFVASGFFSLRHYGSKLLQVIAAPPGKAPVQSATPEGDTVPLSLAPGASITLAMEVLEPGNRIEVFDELTFERRQRALTFFNGAILATLLVLTLGILALTSIREHRAILTSGFLSFAFLVFMAMETGYLEASWVLLSVLSLSQDHLRAFVESVLAVGIAAALWEYLGRQLLRMRFLLGMAAVLAVGVALLVYAYFAPMEAARAARAASLLMVLGGFARVMLDRHVRANSFDFSGTFWSFLAFWIVAAALISHVRQPDIRLHLLLLIGVATVCAVLAFVMMRIALAQGYLARPFMREATRRSLALTGGQHIFWDWLPGTGDLRVGRELALHLGYDPARFAFQMPLASFQRLVHEADAMSFANIFTPSRLKPSQFVMTELRLRDIENRYRWFSLRARVLPDDSGEPVRCIGTLTDITSAKIAEDNLINEAVRDPVTGLPSRALFMDRLEREATKPLGPSVRVVLVDIERFKFLNDGLGHDTGDRLLLAASQRIAECLDPDESIARISGSQFAVMMIDRNAARGPLVLANKILAHLAAPLTVVDPPVVLSACIGISNSSTVSESASQLYREASSALLEAQQEGPGSCLLFHGKMKDERAGKVALEQELRRAIDRHEIAVYYQPILHLQDRSIAGFEALARWNHPQRGMIAPAQFIGMAEEAGLIGSIGDLVLAEAARQLGIWQRVVARHRPIFLSVNVSSDQLSDVTFVDKLGKTIEREGVTPQSLKIEITESVVMRYPERARLLLSHLRTLGVSIACDDFGTGFSNLASLRDLQFDTLKLDRSFIESGELGERGGTIITAVIEMAHSLGMNVVAEGLENEAQVTQLLDLGCDLGQGYLLGEPMPASDIPQLLAVLPVIESLPPLPDGNTAGTPASAPLPGMAPMAPRLESRGAEDNEARKVEVPEVSEPAQPVEASTSEEEPVAQLPFNMVGSSDEDEGVANPTPELPTGQDVVEAPQVPKQKKKKRKPIRKSKPKPTTGNSEPEPEKQE